MAHPAISQARVQAVIAGLAPLPSSVRYYDDFMDVWHSIRHPAELGEWIIQTDGRSHTVQFQVFGHHVRLMKLVSYWQLTTLDPTTVTFYTRFMVDLESKLRGQILDAMLVLKPFEFRELWIASVPILHVGQASALKSCLYACCDLKIGEWTRDYNDYVSKLPMPKKDKSGSSERVTALSRWISSHWSSTISMRFRIWLERTRPPSLPRNYGTPAS